MGVVNRKVASAKFSPIEARKLKTNRICHSTVSYTKKLAMDVQYEWEKFGALGLDDWRFEWDCWRKGYKFYNLKSPLCYYRDSDECMTRVRDREKMIEFKETYLATF
jgi:hypothetical protein